jgi:hypothetical protein
VRRTSTRPAAPTPTCAARSNRCRRRRRRVSVRDAAGHETLSFQEHKAPISEVQLGFDGRFAVSTDRAGALKVWDAATGRVAVAQQWPTENAAADRTRPNPRFSADGRRLAMNVPEGVVKVWDLTDGVREVFACEARTPVPLLNAAGWQPGAT